MELRGRFDTISKSGHRLDELKSAIQKFARRGETDLMIKAVYEMDLFKEAARLPFVKAIRTNMINRLSVILFEDVSFSQYGVYQKVIENLVQWDLDRSKGVPKGALRVDRFDCLVRICQYISKAKKLRLPSHLNHFFKDMENQVTEEEFIRSIDSGTYEPGFGFIFQSEDRAYQLLLDRMGTDQVSKFVQKEYKRMKKASKPIERLVYLIVPWLWIMFKDRLDETTPTYADIDQSLLDTDLVLPDYVYDIHTGKGKKEGKVKQDFLMSGSYVVNDDVEFMVPKYKEFYMTLGTRSQVPERPTGTTNIIRDQPKNWTRLINRGIMLIDGVCGRKLPCIDTGRKILKQVKDLDYMFVNSNKDRFGVKSFKMKVVRSNMKLKWIGPKQYEWVPGEALFCVMEKIDHKGDLGHNKHLLEDEEGFKDMLKVRLFNGLFGTSDNVLRNILVGKDDSLYPIDEHDMLGSRKTIFNKVEPVKKSRLFTGEVLTEVISSLRIEDNLESVIQDMVRYGYGSKIEQFRKRALTYKDIVLSEVGLTLTV